MVGPDGGVGGKGKCTTPSARLELGFKVPADAAARGHTQPGEDGMGWWW